MPPSPSTSCSTALPAWSTACACIQSACWRTSTRRAASSSPSPCSSSSSTAAWSGRPPTSSCSATRCASGTRGATSRTCSPPIRRCSRASAPRTSTRHSTSTTSSGTSPLCSNGCWGSADLGNLERASAPRGPPSAPILACVARLRPLAPEDLHPLAVLEDRHVAAGPDLERLLARSHLVELVAARFAEPLEPARISEVRERDAGDLERLVLDGIRYFVSIEGAVRRLGGEIDGRIGQHLCQFMRGGDADQVLARDGGPHEDLAERQPLRGQVVVSERVRLIGIVEEDEGPAALLDRASRQKRRRHAPDRRESFVHVLLQGGDQRVLRHPPRRFRLVHDGDDRLLAAIELRGDEALRHSRLSFGIRAAAGSRPPAASRRCGRW